MFLFRGNVYVGTKVGTSHTSDTRDVHTTCGQRTGTLCSVQGLFAQVGINQKIKCYGQFILVLNDQA